MKIGDVARRSGVPAKNIRYYEEVGLLDPPARGNNGYRRYTERDVEILRFVRRARRLGFPVADVGGLLALWLDRNRASAEVKALAQRHVEGVERRIRELEEVRSTLQHLIHECHGDERPECPILESLAGGEDRCHEETEE